MKIFPLFFLLISCAYNVQEKEIALSLPQKTSKISNLGLKIIKPVSAKEEFTFGFHMLMSVIPVYISSGYNSSEVEKIEKKTKTSIFYDTLYPILYKTKPSFMVNSEGKEFSVSLVKALEQAPDTELLLYPKFTVQCQSLTVPYYLFYITYNEKCTVELEALAAKYEIR